MATRFRDWEILYEDIVHMYKELTLNQGISVLVVESLLFTHKEKVEVSLVVCKLEYLRSKKMYTDALGAKLYESVCDIFDYTPPYEKHLNMGKVLDEFLQSKGLFMSKQDYLRIIPIVGPYFRFNIPHYKAELIQRLFPVSASHLNTEAVIGNVKPMNADRIRGRRFFPWRKRRS